MPIYNFHCDKCNKDEEIFQWKLSPPICCGENMQYVFSAIAMVKMNGEGGYPSRRKFFKGTAFGASNSSKEWTPANPQPLDAPSLNSYPKKDKIIFQT